MRSFIAFIVTAPLLAACGDNGSMTTAEPTTGSSGDATTTTTGVPTTSGSTGGPTCTPGEIVCLDDNTQSECGDDGKPGAGVACMGGVCSPGMGCAECQTGDVRCNGDSIEQCGEAGTWEVQTACNAAQGLTCDEGTMTCTGACAPEELAQGELTASGCEFYAATMINLSGNSPGSNFGVVIENPGATDVTVTVSQKANFPVMTDVVPAGTAKAILLPWAAPLYNAFKGELLADGAYKIESDAPVRVFQYSTYELTASVDSTILWPRHTWGTDYFAASYGSTPIMMGETFYRGAWVMIGAEDMTKGVVTPRPGTKAKGGPGIGLNGGGNTQVQSGDVLQILSADDGDLTGAHLVTEKPVAVLGGHECAFMPAGDVGYCDHLEDSMLPTSQLGTTYVLVPPVKNKNAAERRAQVVRVIATDGPTTLTYDPPQMDAPTMIAGTGEFVELAPSPEVYVLTADKPVLVAQYMVGNQFDKLEADPAMLATLPVDRFHTEHWVHALPMWMQLDVDIIAPMGAVVDVGGMLVGSWTPVGGSGYQVGHVRFTMDPGLVAIESDQPIAVNVYSTTSKTPTTSYWHHTGGLLAAP